MSISNRATILASLKTTLEAISIINGFQLDVKLVLRGYVSPKDAKGKTPTLSILNTKRPSKITTQGDPGYKEGILKISIIGYVEVPSIMNGYDYDKLDKLSADVEKILSTPTPTVITNNAYNQYAGWTSNFYTEYYEGGIPPGMASFVMDVDIVYDYLWTNP